MTDRHLLLAHILRVAIRAVRGLLVLLKLFFDRRDFWIGRLLVVLMTSDARGDWNIKSKTAQRASPRYVDMTGRAFHHMLALAAFVTEHCGNTFRRYLCNEGCGGFVTTGALVAGGLLIFPMTTEARIMAMRHCLEKLIRLHRLGRHAGLRQEWRDDQVVVPLMADRTVVVIRFFVFRD